MFLITINKHFKNRPKNRPKNSISLKNNLVIMNKVSLNVTYQSNFVSKFKKISNMSIFYKDISSFFKLYDQILNSSSSSIIKNSLDSEQYIINTRIVNYKLDNEGKSDIGYKKCITINKIDILDKNFNIIKSKYLFPNNFSKQYIGIEDVRLFNNNNKIYYIGSYYNSNNKKIQIVSNQFNINEDFEKGNYAIGSKFKLTFSDIIK